MSRQDKKTTEENRSEEEWWRRNYKEDGDERTTSAALMSLRWCLGLRPRQRQRMSLSLHPGLDVGVVGLSLCLGLCLSLLSPPHRQDDPVLHRRQFRRIALQQQLAIAAAAAIATATIIVIVIVIVIAVIADVAIIFPPLDCVWV